MRVLTWNLKHGRAVPPAGRCLLEEFGAALAGWEWDAALLQEVPPWWPEQLAQRAGADARSVLTSRNFGLPLRRLLATRWPELMKSNGGGANAILVRGAPVLEHRVRRLCRLPERRWLHAVRAGEVWIANLHATAHDDAAALRDDRLAARSAIEWSNGAACVLGGDFNLRTLSLAGFERAGGHDVDHVFVRGAPRPVDVHVLDSRPLSDHAPVLVRLSGQL